MTIVIECEACQSRFRLDEGLFKGARAIRVRCRKCGGPIVALNPDIPETSYMEEPEPATRPAPEENQQREAPAPAPEPPPSFDEPDPQEPAVDAAPVSEERIADTPSAPEPPPEAELPFRLEEEPPLKFDLSAEVQAEPDDSETGREKPAAAEDEPAQAGAAEAAEASDASAGAERFSAILDDLLSSLPDDPPKTVQQAPPDPSEAKAPLPLSELIEPDPSELYPRAPAGSDALTSALEGLFAPPTPEPVVHPPHVDDNRPRRYAQPPPMPLALPERPPYTRPLFLAGVALWLLLLAGGALFFGTGGSGGMFGRSLLPSAGGAGSSPAGTGAYEIRGVQWETVRKTDAGDLFVVRGTVVNAGAQESGGIRIQATLLGADNGALGERDVFAGNVIDDTTLRHASQVVLKGALNKRFGDGDRNKEIPPGGSLPFMVVFFDPPADIGSILVKGVDAP